MGTVTSILGRPYHPPCYHDRRGRLVTVTLSLVDETGRHESAVVTGQQTVLGLVLHRPCCLYGDKVEPKRGWSISEPTTGRLVARGRTRQDAVDAVAALVAFCGGEEAFRSVLDESIRRHHHA